MAIDTALELVKSLEGMAPRRGVLWLDPLVSPDPAGGVDLHWTGATEWLLVTVPPLATARVQLTGQCEGWPPWSRWASLSEAAEAAVGLFLLVGEEAEA